MVVAADATSAEIKVLSTNTTYEIRVEAIKGTSVSAPVSITASTLGVSATLTDLSPGTRHVTWTANDSLLGTATITRDITLAVGQSAWLPAPPDLWRPEATIGRDAMAGRQALLAPQPCPSTGKRASLTAGYRHTCALTSSGGVKCWGDNGFGAIGVGDTTPRLTPVNVTALGTSVVAIAAGDYHTCALSATGAVKCWGWNVYGGLGLGDTTPRYTSVDVTALGTSVVGLTAGAMHTCALTALGAVKCWGLNSSNGELGLGDSTNRLTPTDLTALGTSIVALTAGSSHTCALTTAGTVKCWGYGSYGGLGLGDTLNRLAPVDTSMQDGAVLIQTPLVASP